MTMQQGRQRTATTTTTTALIRLCRVLFRGMALCYVLVAASAQPAPPQLQGQHFRITALQEHGFLDIHDDNDGGVRYSGYLIDMLEALARPERANFTYTLRPPSGYGSLCAPRLNASDPTTATTVPYDAHYRTQYNCGASDVNDNVGVLDDDDDAPQHATHVYLGMYYVTPSRQEQNQFTLPFVPPFSGTLSMFGTAVGIPSFEALVEQQAAGRQPAACAPAGTALIDFLATAYDGLQVRGIYGGEDEIYRAFRDGTCTVYMTDGPIAAQFVLRRSRRDECLANGRPIGVIGKPMDFGLSHYAIGIRRDVDPHVVDTISYWINVLMSCNPYDPQGGCTDGNLATFYEGRGGDGTECDYVLFPDTQSGFSGFAIAGIVVSSAFVVVIVYSLWHRHRLARQRRLYKRRQEATLAIAKRERELNEFVAHEIRNPLSSAIAALNFVSNKSCDPAMVPLQENRALLKEDISVIDSSLSFVNELLRNMLDLHRSSDKAMNLKMGPTDLLRDVLEPVVSIIFLRGAKVNVVAECEPSTLIVQADRMRLKQICLNLASNAAKFVEQGYIRLRAQLEPSSKNDGTPANVVLDVEDSGPGIPAEKRNQLFAKFQESVSAQKSCFVPKTRSRSSQHSVCLSILPQLDVLNQGTGLGLSGMSLFRGLLQFLLFVSTISCVTHRHVCVGLLISLQKS